MLDGHVAGDVLAGIVVAVGVIGAWRRSLGAAFAVVLAAEIISNGSLTGLTQAFLFARWVGLCVLALVLLPHARTAWRRFGYRVLLTGVAPAVAIVSTVWSVDARLTFERGISFGILVFVVTTLGFCWATGVESLDRFIEALAALSLAVLLSSLAIAISGNGFLNGSLRGVFENPNGLGLFLGLTYPFVAQAVEKRRLAWMRLVVLSAYGTVAALSDSRSGMVALGITAIGFELNRRRRFWVAVIGVGAVVTGAILLVSASRPPPALAPPAPTVAAVVTGFPQTPNQTLPFFGRLTGARDEAWSAAWGLIKSRPLGGYGFGTGDQLFARYPNRVHFVGFEGANPNEGYLQAVLELGVLGAAVLLPLLLAGLCGVRLLVRERSSNVAPVALCLIAGLAAGFVESIFTSAGAPWALLLWGCASACVVLSFAPLTAEDSRAQRVRFKPLVWPSRPSSRVIALLVCLIVLVCVGGGLAVDSWLGGGGNKQSSLTASTRFLAQKASCGVVPCRVRAVTALGSGYWWVHLGGTTSVCYVVRPDSLDLKASLPALIRQRSSLVDATCRSLPLQHQHVLTVGVLNSYYPYFAATASGLTGYEPTLVEKIAKDLGIGLVEWRPVSAATPVGQFDLVVHVIVDAGQPHPEFVPYLAFRAELLAKLGSRAASVRTFSAAGKLRLGTLGPYRGTGVTRFIRPLRPPLSFATLPAAAKALRTGEVDALVLSQANASGLARSTPSFVGAGLFPPGYFMGIRFRSGSRLEPLVAARIADLRKGGKLQRLIDSTLGSLLSVRALK